MSENEFSIDNKVVISNNFILDLQGKMNAMPLKLFRVAISCIDTKNPKRTVYVNRKELYQFLDTEEDEANYLYIRKSFKKLVGEVMEFKDEEENYYLFNPITFIRYPKRYENKPIEITFNEFLEPYLINLKSRFLQYDIANLKYLNSKHSIILYEYLLSEERSKHWEDHTYKVSIEKLRHITDTEEKYKSFKDFEKRVLAPAVKEINESGVEFLTKYDKVKAWREVTHISFTLRKRTSYKEKVFSEIANKEYLDQKI